MSHRRPSFRRSLVPALAFLTCASGAVVTGAPAQAVPSPASIQVTLPNAADSIALDDNRLLTNTGINGTRITRADAVAFPLVGFPAVAPGVATYASTSLSTADNHTFATSGGVDVVSLATGRVQARRGATKLLDVARPSGSTWSVDISGPYVRVGRNVYDVRRGVSASAIVVLPTTMTSAALYGSRLAWSEADGAVRYRDVATHNATSTLRNGTKGCTTCRQQVAINSTTVAYGAAGGWLGLWDVTSRVSRPQSLMLTGVERLRLGDGFLVTTLLGDDGLSLYRLNDPLTLSAPDAFLDGVHVVDLAADGRGFAWTRTDGSVWLTQLPDSVDGQRNPTVLVSSIQGAFSPNGDKVVDAWTPSFYLTRPVTTWKVQVRDPRTNAAIATFASAVAAPATSAVGITWKPVNKAQAAYPWTFTGTSVDGAVVNARGGPVTGVVNLRRTNDRTTAIKAPLDVAVAGRSVRTPLSWRPAGTFPSGLAAASYDVQVRSVRIVKGKRVYGKAGAVLNRTKKGSTTFAGTRGATYQFRARNKDNVGLTGPWSAWATSNTPLDDRSKGVRYGKGWTSAKAAGRWDGTHHWTKKSKRTMRVDKRQASGFALVMRTCSTCGSVKVYVDGKLRTTVNLSTSSTLRREVWSVSFKKLGKHSIKVVSVVKGKKKLVAIDAVLVRH